MGKWYCGRQKSKVNRTGNGMSLLPWSRDTVHTSWQDWLPSRTCLHQEDSSFQQVEKQLEQIMLNEKGKDIN